MKYFLSNNRCLVDKKVQVIAGGMFLIELKKRNLSE
jgi:hypothetical protein